MNKLKITTKSGITQLTIKSLKGQQLNENEVYAINSNRVNGVLHMDIVPSGSGFKLVYNISGFATLQDYLTVPMNKARFASMLQNILANFKSMKFSYLNQQYVLMDFDKVMVNPTNNHIYFIYVPIQNFENNASLREFLLSIIQYSSFVQNEDNSYIRDYINILNRGVNFSEFDLEEYVNKLLGINVEKTTKIKCTHCGVELQTTSKYCTACGAKLSGATGKTGKTGKTSVVFDNTESMVYTPPVQPVVPPTPPVQPVVPPTPPVRPVVPPAPSVQPVVPPTPPVQPVVPPAPPISKYDNRIPDTTVLGVDYDDTTVMGYEAEAKPNYPYLVRVKNNDKIYINKPVFRIGKEKKYCDYFVRDNNAVSRSHADIITRENRYFIVDKNSTNRTYVDGRAIPIEREIEIFSGTKVRLANENFTFVIE